MSFYVYKNPFKLNARTFRIVFSARVVSFPIKPGLMVHWQAGTPELDINNTKNYLPVSLQFLQLQIELAPTPKCLAPIFRLGPPF